MEKAVYGDGLYVPNRKFSHSESPDFCYLHFHDIKIMRRDSKGLLLLFYRVILNKSLIYYDSIFLYSYSILLFYFLNPFFLNPFF